MRSLQRTEAAARCTFAQPCQVWTAHRHFTDLRGAAALSRPKPKRLVAPWPSRDCCRCLPEPAHVCTTHVSSKLRLDARQLEQRVEADALDTGQLVFDLLCEAAAPTCVVAAKRRKHVARERCLHRPCAAQGCSSIKATVCSAQRKASSAIQSTGAVPTCRLLWLYVYPCTRQALKHRTDGSCI